jgi:hypothetical protein
MIEELISDKNTMRVIEFLILHERWEQNQKDLCEALEIYPKSMKEIITNLVKYEIIIPNKKIAKSILYVINEKNPLVKTFRVLITQFNDLNMKKIYESNCSNDQFPECIQPNENKKEK